MELDPPTPANFLGRVGLACHTCYKTHVDESSSVATIMVEVDAAGVAGCGTAALVSGDMTPIWMLPYSMGTECQKDWAEHKALCNAIRSVEQNPSAVDELVKVFDDPTGEEDQRAERLARQYSRQVVAMYEKVLGRPPKQSEFDILAAEPKCFGCGHSNLSLLAKAERATESLEACPHCHMTFYCPEHASSAALLHEAPSADISPANLMTAQDAKALMWQVIPRQLVWTSLKGLTWEAVMSGNVNTAVATSPKFASQGPTFLRHISSLATSAMTVLYVLEQLSSNLAWTTKSELILHFIGHPSEFGQRINYVYEAILHRLPNLKMLSLFFFSPGNIGGTSRLWMTDVCGGCRSKGAKIANHFCVRTYEGFIHNEAELFMNPNLCISANGSFLMHRLPDQWRRTVQLLISRGIPTVFTAESRRHAEQDLEFLRECGAAFIEDFTAVKNLFADLLKIPASGTLTRFEGANAWFVALPSQLVTLWNL
ncbi:hypothetical protein C8R46DRAFT_1362320 [Mycena filopes]|nr:hypothetical protein C8R46DRAFT_1362320 [Mycena filopes]